MSVEVASTLRARLVGLYGRRGFDGTLMLVPCNDIHTIAMRRPIDVAFVASDGTVIESLRCVPPNRRLKNGGASATLERFASDEPWYVAGDKVQQGIEITFRP